jgi:predicted PurR-regulated permease PerM
MWKKIKKSPLNTGLILIAAWRASEGFTLSGAHVFLGRVLGPCFAAACLAFVLNIPLVFFEKRVTKRFFSKSDSPKAVPRARAISLAASIFCVAAASALVLLFCVPDIARSLDGIASLWPAWSANFDASLKSLEEKAPFLASILPNESLDDIAKGVAESFAGASASAASVVGGVLSRLSDAAISLFLAIFLLLNKERVGIQIRRGVFAFMDPVNAELCVRVSRFAELRFRSFVISAFAGAAIEGANFLIVLFVFGFPYPVAIASLLAALALIPVLGAVVGFCVCSTLVAIAQPAMVWWFVAVYILVNQFDQQVIYPKLVGRAIGLDAFWVLFAVSIGAPLAGAPGIVFAVPLTSILYTIVSEYVEYYIGEKKVPPEKYM